MVLSLGIHMLSICLDRGSCHFLIAHSQMPTYLMRVRFFPFSFSFDLCCFGLFRFFRYRCCCCYCWLLCYSPTICIWMSVIRRRKEIKSKQEQQRNPCGTCVLQSTKKCLGVPGITRQCPKVPVRCWFNI